MAILGNYEDSSDLVFKWSSIYIWVTSIVHNILASRREQNHVRNRTSAHLKEKISWIWFLQKFLYWAIYFKGNISKQGHFIPLNVQRSCYVHDFAPFVKSKCWELLMWPIYIHLELGLEDTSDQSFFFLPEFHSPKGFYPEDFLARGSLWPKVQLARGYLTIVTQCIMFDQRVKNAF